MPAKSKRRKSRRQQASADKVQYDIVPRSHNENILFTWLISLLAVAICIFVDIAKKSIGLDTCFVIVPLAVLDIALSHYANYDIDHPNLKIGLIIKAFLTIYATFVKLKTLPF